MHISEVGFKISGLIEGIDHYIAQNGPEESVNEIAEVREHLLKMKQLIDRHPLVPISTALYIESFCAKNYLGKSLDVVKAQDEMHPQAELRSSIFKIATKVLKIVSHNKEAAEAWRNKVFNALRKEPTDMDLDNFSHILAEGIKDGFLLIQNNALETIFHEVAKTEDYLHYLILIKEVGFSPAVLNDKKQNPLYVAIDNGNLKMAQTIIAVFGEGSYLNGDSKNQIPLNLIITLRNYPNKKYPKDHYLSLIQILLEAGADVNLPTKAGYTALHKASQRRDVEVVELLLRAGADADLKNCDQQTPLDMLDPEMSLSYMVDHDAESKCYALLAASMSSFAGVSAS